MSLSDIHDVIIVGSGPAGYTAALYAARANLKPVMFLGPQPGGQLIITTDVENYPGFPDGILGPELMEKFSQQAAKFETQMHYKTITKVDFAEQPFKIWTEDDELLLSKTVIISTGASAQWLGLESESFYNGYGVSACATCDGPFFKNQTVMIVGGGDTAMEEASYLSRLCEKVYLVHRRNEFRASKIMQKRVLENPKIEIIWNSILEEVIGETTPHKHVTHAKIKNIITQATQLIPLKGIFIAIGHHPNTEIFKGQLETDDQGYLMVQPYSTKTAIPGVFAAGDVTDKVYRQAITAAGMGCMAAIDAERYLLELE